MKIQSRLAFVFVLLSVFASGCSLVGGGGDVVGFPDIDLGVDVVVYHETPERDLHLHLFEPAAADADRPAVLFFHGGGFAATRVEQFERQAQLVADAGMVGVIVEYRVTAEGTTRDDAVFDGAVALDYVMSNAADFGIDPDRVAMAGASAGGALATVAVDRVGPPTAGALVLFNPAVSSGSADFAGSVPTIVFHSREDTIVDFSNAEAFCEALSQCELVAFDEGDHGFFNDDPAFTETVEAMMTFFTNLGWA